jgi:hypothetical protein
MMKVQPRSITDILGKNIVATVPDTVTTWSTSGDIPTLLPAIAENFSSHRIGYRQIGELLADNRLKEDQSTDTVLSPVIFQ